MSKRYLITGAAGFIGSHLAEALLRRGDEVVGLDNLDDYYDPALKRRNLEAALAQRRYRFVEGDIRDRALTEGILSGERFDAVFHLAARAGVRPSIEDPLLYQSVNVEGTSVILEAMRRTGTRRLLFASSSSVYGNNPGVPFRESDAVDHPISPYAATKKAGELLCHSYHHLFGIEAACLRFFTVYGPRQRPEMAISKFTRLILEGEEVPMFGDGTTVRDYTFIDDVIQGILAVEARFSGYAILNLGGSQTTTLAGLIGMVGRAAGVQPRIRVLPAQPGDVVATFADVSEARRLGYEPRTSIDEGIRIMVEWVRDARAREEARQPVPARDTDRVAAPLRWRRPGRTVLPHARVIRPSPI